MIFPSVAILAGRKTLFEKWEKGEIPPEEFSERLLKLDPNDPVALLMLAASLKKSGDLAEAERICWRGIEAHPCDYRFYIQLGQVFHASDPESLACSGVMALAFKKLALNDWAFENWKEEVSLREPPPEGISERDRLEIVAETLEAETASEPPEMTSRLHRIRLIHQMEEGAGEGLDRETVDEIIAEGRAISGLLEGVLRGWAEDVLPEDYVQVVVSALALLGEIGGAEAIPSLFEFLESEDPALSGCADWAIRRVMSRFPEESLAALRNLTPHLDPSERISACVFLAELPASREVAEALVDLLKGTEKISRAERSELALLVIGALLGTQGRRGLELARETLRRHRSDLDRETRAACEGLIEMTQTGEAPPYPRTKSDLTVYDICESGYPVSPEEDDDPDEEDRWTSPAPVHAAPKPGRNDPCWCGSGKKYKKCHLAADQGGSSGRSAPPPPQRPPSQTEDSGIQALRQRVGAFIGSEITSREMEKAVERFFAGTVDLPGPEKADHIAFIDWLNNDYVLPGRGCTVLEAFLKRFGPALSVREDRIVRRWIATRVGLYEVQDTSPGKGITLKDMLAGDVFFVHDVSTSRSLAKWDCVLCRIEDLEDKKMLTGVALIVPRPRVAEFRDWIIEEHARSGQPWSDFLRDNSHRLRRRIYEMHDEFADSLRVVSAEGDPLVFCKAFYQVKDESALIEALESLPELQHTIRSGAPAEAPEEFVWLEKPARVDGPNRVLGSIRIERRRMTLECSSRQRLERGKKLLEARAGAAIKSIGDEFKDVQTALRETKDHPPAPSRSKIPKEVEQEIIGKALADHYRTWPDQPLPALDGQTPREALATPAGRERVEDLLKSIENGEERNRLDGRPWFDVAQLRRELKL